MASKDDGVLLGLSFLADSSVRESEHFFDNGIQVGDASSSYLFVGREAVLANGVWVGSAKALAKLLLASRIVAQELHSPTKGCTCGIMTCYDKTKQLPRHSLHQTNISACGSLCPQRQFLYGSSDQSQT
ncbi:cytochrome P450 [Colletotrichum scovillei]|uniref:Cytochrome P450 n=1 Tax=Colletotrichum scovillei TaxID=1209932 RepID=A0A9P7QZS3_9PEZI|nr:cytochrome P450 [Colletotrichum scovillei]KAG7046193.1 cytochrome P450 [Colletotrichum scovillei]KAG7063540.1 cytochrome P450 [Colletotrichum scovillei]